MIALAAALVLVVVALLAVAWQLVLDGRALTP